MECYEFALTSNGYPLSASVTKQGGAVLYYKNEMETDGLSILPTAARIHQLEEIAEDFLEERGYGDCEPGWKSYYNGMAVIEMIPEAEEDVLLFPDLVKVWINLQNGTVMGMDARNYLMNHREREFPEEILSAEELRGRLSENLTVLGTEMALIPQEDGKEYYCRGFLCKAEKQEIIVFLDAQTGAERDLLVIYETPNSKQVL